MSLIDLRSAEAYLISINSVDSKLTDEATHTQLDLNCY